MSIRPEDFTVRPLFYDALSGEFTPATDPRQHTLGRLAVATIKKGSYSLQDSGSYPAYSYTPSWAPEVTCEVDGVFTIGGRAILQGISLSRDNDRSLYVRDYAGTAVDVIGGAEDMRYELELGEHLLVARQAVSAAAEAFFA